MRSGTTQKTAFNPTATPRTFRCHLQPCGPLTGKRHAK
jgi:hypothetical protein